MFFSFSGRLEDLLDRSIEPRPTIDLHTYLKSKEYVADLAEGWTPYQGKDFHAMIESVKTGYSFVLRTQNQMKLYLAFGECLEKLFYLYKLNKPIVGAKPWKNWLNDEFKITESFARKLRIFYKEFREYERFKTLCMSFYELYGLKSKLTEMLLDNEKANYWKSL